VKIITRSRELREKRDPNACNLIRALFLR